MGNILILQFNFNEDRRISISINMSSTDRDANYYTKRQKNNEAARLSRLKRKEIENQTEKEKRKLEASYVKLHRELLQIHKMKLDQALRTSCLEQLKRQS
ncbi:uncharacterized protein LOC111036135 [Myzus persicae]|uniref:uncharacterized protein LOC111036135 n=1 Tax=Myzus persicae TaxID=13164 RepID=UPI000B939679|nr:uncharacterized protein LOC111036135 [Myzus persicae]